MRNKARAVAFFFSVAVRVSMFHIGLNVQNKSLVHLDLLRFFSTC